MNTRLAVNFRRMAVAYLGFGLRADGVVVLDAFSHGEDSVRECVCPPPSYTLVHIVILNMMITIIVMIKFLIDWIITFTIYF